MSQPIKAALPSAIVITSPIATIALIVGIDVGRTIERALNRAVVGAAAVPAFLNHRGAPRFLDFCLLQFRLIQPPQFRRQCASATPTQMILGLVHRASVYAITAPDEPVPARRLNSVSAEIAVINHLGRHSFTS